MTEEERRNACALFKYGDRVRYVPYHANGDAQDPSCEDGTVSSQNGTFVFVRFDRQVKVLGWSGTTSQGCDPQCLMFLGFRS